MKEEMKLIVFLAQKSRHIVERLKVFKAVSAERGQHIV